MFPSIVSVDMPAKKYAKVIRFLMSGGVSALVEYSTFLLLHGLGLVLVLANALSFSCGLVVSFLLNKHWVFSHKGSARKQFAQYLVLAGVNLAAGSGVIVVLVHGLGLRPFVAKLCVMVMVAAWNFVIYQKIIFRHPEPGSPGEF